MSEVRVNNIVDYGGKGAPTFDNGAVISGVSSLGNQAKIGSNVTCLLYTSPSPRDVEESRMPSSA